MRAPTIRELDIAIAERSLAQYVKQAWHILEPATNYVHGRHIDVIAEHLEAISKGQIQNLIINIPPGMMKSLLVGVFWATWDWIASPQRRFLTASYAQPLSTRDALKARRLIESDWYQARWGERFKLASDQNQKTRYENDRTGFRIATSVNGTVTGERGDIRILDDPHKADEIKSEVSRLSDLEWLKTVWATRKNAANSAEVLVMQRLHQKDATGYYLAEIGGYEHLCLPMRFEGNFSITSLGPADWRTEPGELLLPERFDEKEVTNLEKRLGDDAPGQLQQRPTAAEGGIFQKAWWDIESGRNRYHVADEKIRNRVVARWLMFDTALKDKAQNDLSACAVWELWPDYRVAVRWMWQERVLSALLPQKIEAIATRWNYDGKLREVVIEDKGSGITSIQTLRISAPSWLSGIVVEFQPKGEKEFRAKLGSHWCSQDCVQLPYPSDEVAEWYSQFLDPEKGQLFMFPNAEHDDLVDVFDMGILYLENHIAEGWQARMRQ